MNTILFDLDGTLLPLDQEEFLKTYFKYMANFTAPLGIDPKKLIKAIWVGTDAMVANDGSMTNEEKFWSVFDLAYGNSEEASAIRPVLEAFYEKEFDKAKVVARPNPLAKTCIRRLKEKGYTLALTTNPLFPSVATSFRIQWAGLDPEDFVWVTTYENSTFCKPNMGYYNEVLKNIGKNPGECLLVGNDVEEDLCVEGLGIETFLLTDHVINKNEADLSHLRQGSFEALASFIESLPNLSLAKSSFQDGSTRVKSNSDSKLRSLRKVDRVK